MLDDNEERYLARDFVEVLREMRAGECVNELTTELNKATQAAVETGKAGSVTLTIKISPQGTQAMVSDQIKATIPKFTPQPTVMFVDDNFNLSRKNPKQLSFDDVVTTSGQDDTVKVSGDEDVVPAK